MCKTEYIKNYVDEIIVDNSDKEQVQIIGLTAGYQFDESGECPIEMRFYDGMAIATDDSGLVMRYPTLAKVRADESMQHKIYQHCGNRVCDHIEQWDVALTFGKLEKYKMVADYNLWCLQADNADCEIFAVSRDFDHMEKEDDWWLMDVLEEDFYEMEEKGIIEVRDGSYLLMAPYTNEQLIEYRAKYGVCWCEHFTDDIEKVA